MKVAMVCRAGGEFTPAHAEALAKQVKRHFSKPQELMILSDFDIAGHRDTPLRQRYPGWWAKMELCRPELPGDLLYFDLDTVLAGNCDELLTVCGDTPIFLRDFYRNGRLGAEGLQSSVMWLPQWARLEAWREWTRDPMWFMNTYRKGGDQAFFEHLWLPTAERWQDLLPGTFASWKVDCKKGVPPEAKVIVFHGKPRPWAVPQFKGLYE